MKKKDKEHESLKRKQDEFLNNEKYNLSDNALKVWKPEIIVKGIKLRIGLGVHGYKLS